MTSPQDLIASVRLLLSYPNLQPLGRTYLAYLNRVLNEAEQRLSLTHGAEQRLWPTSEVDVAHKIKEFEEAIQIAGHCASHERSVTEAIDDVNNRAAELLSLVGIESPMDLLAGLLSESHNARHNADSGDLNNMADMDKPAGLLARVLRRIRRRPETLPAIEQEFTQALWELQHTSQHLPTQSVPLVLYVKRGNHLTAQQAMIDLAKEFGSVEAFPPLEGSFFQRLRVWTNRQGAHELREAMRRAAELPLEEQQANVNALQAEAASKLIASLDNTETAAGLVGSMLVIKINGALTIRTLTNREIIYLSRHPGLIRDPASMQVALDSLAVESDEPAKG